MTSNVFDLTGRLAPMAALFGRSAPPAEPLRVVLAGGGTGGHLFPAIAVAESIRSRWPDSQVHFLGARSGIEARVLPERGWPVWLLDLSRLRGLRPAQQLQSLWRLGVGVREATKHIRAFRPHLVLGVGGYASAAGILAAKRLGIYRAIHEQNAVAGFTNRTVGRIVHRVYTGFEAANKSFAADRVLCVGNPVRGDIATVRSRALSDQAAVGALRVLVVGGSQGARFLNQHVPALLAQLAGQRPVHVRHQSGPAEENMVRDAYARHSRAGLRDGLRAEVVPFVHDMADAYSWADVAICRAGAGTVSELCAVGLPAVLVPFPHAASDHQTANARALVDVEAAWIAPQSDWQRAGWDAVLASLQPAELQRRAERARGLSHDRAADALVSDVTQRLVRTGAWAGEVRA